MDLQDEIEKLIKRRDGQPLVKLPTPTRKKSSKAKAVSPHRPKLKDSSKRIAMLLRISRQKVAQQKNMGAYSVGRKSRKKRGKGKGKKKKFPKEWVMKYAQNDPLRRKAPLVQKFVCKKCHLAYDTVPLEGLVGPMECKVTGICDNCKPLTKKQKLAQEAAAIAEAELAATMAKLAKDNRKTPLFRKKPQPKVKVRSQKPLCKSLFTFIHEQVHNDWDGLAVRAKEILARTLTRDDLIGMARGPPRLGPQHSIDYYQKMFVAEAEEEAAEAEAVEAEAAP